MMDKDDTPEPAWRYKLQGCGGVPRALGIVWSGLSQFQHVLFEAGFDEASNVFLFYSRTSVALVDKTNSIPFVGILSPLTELEASPPCMRP
jgi:hypothetical protein